MSGKMKFYDYFKKEWERQKIFTSEELEEMENVERDGNEVSYLNFIDYCENRLGFMDKSKKSKRHKKNFDFISDDDKKKIAKELVHRIIMYALSYFETKPEAINNNEAFKQMRATEKKSIKRSIENFKRYNKPTEEQKRINEENKKKLRELNKTPAKKIKDTESEMINIFLQSMSLMDKFAYNTEEKREAQAYMLSLIKDLQNKDFIKTKRYLFYDTATKPSGAVDKTAIKNYLMEINNRYDLKATTKINEFCRNIFPYFELKRKKNLKKFTKNT